MIARALITIRTVLFIALRHLRIRRRQTMLSVGGVSIGSMILIMTLSLTEGLVDAIVGTVLDITPPILLTSERLNPTVSDILVEADLVSCTRRAPPERRNDIRPVQREIARLQALPYVEHISPYVEVRVLLRSRGRYKTVRLLGIDPRLEDRVVPLEKKIFSGSFRQMDSQPNGLLLGYRIARDLTIKVGDSVQAVTGSGAVIPLIVAGLVKSGLKSLDESLGYIHVRQARIMGRVPDTAADGLRIAVTDIRQVSRNAAYMAGLTGYKVETWEDQNRNMLDLFKRNNRITLFLVLFTFVVAGFGIRNMLVTLVLEKNQDIAILRSMGMTASKTVAIFITEGFIIGMLGTVIGLTLGLAGIFLVRSIPASYGEAAIIATTSIPMAIAGWFFVITAAFNMVIAVAASRAPARRAASLDPVTILRGDV